MRDSTAEMNTGAFTQVQGPREEVKPLRPAMMYCTACGEFTVQLSLPRARIWQWWKLQLATEEELGLLPWQLGLVSCGR